MRSHGETIVLVVETHAERPGGGRYNNVYALMSKLEGGQIAHVRNSELTLRRVAA